MYVTVCMSMSLSMSVSVSVAVAGGVGSDQLSVGSFVYDITTGTMVLYDPACCMSSKDTTRIPNPA